MKLEAFLLIFLCIVIDSCSAAECPVRAIFAPTPEVDGGYGCVCRQSFYGDKCQYQAQNRSALEVDAIWWNNSTAAVTWKSTYGREFHLSVRRANYGPKGRAVFGKWRKAAVNFVSIRMESSEVGWETGRAIFTAQLSLMKHLSYQIRLVELSSGDGNWTASVFHDAREELAVDDMSHLNNTENEQKSCFWSICPARLFGEIMKDFGTSCFNRGAIFAVLVTVFGTFLLGGLLYIAIRQCKKQHNKQNIDQPAVDSAGLPTTIHASGVELQEVCSNICIAVLGKKEKSPFSDKSIHGIKEEPKSVVIDIPEIVVTAPLSEADSQSESSEEESSSDEGEYILP